VSLDKSQYVEIRTDFKLKIFFNIHGTTRFSPNSRGATLKQINDDKYLNSRSFYIGNTHTELVCQRIELGKMKKDKL